MDDPSTPTLLTLACRYIPHDQWLLTHLNPSWKIRDIKSYILSKCLGTPFEAPADTFSVADSRPRSPIVFADPRNRPISPIKFAAPKPGGRIDGAESDEDEWDEDGYDSDDSARGSVSMHGGLVARGSNSIPYRSYVPRTVTQSPQPHRHHTRSSSLSSIGGYGSASGHRTSYTVGPSSSHGHHHSQHPPAELILQPYHFTLLRFSTCQLLEDDFRLADYELTSYELLEMHCSYSFPPPTLPKPKNHPTKRLITPLPRFDINAYIQPYWEGWVRALRLVRRDDADWYEYAMGSYPALGAGAAGGMVSADGTRREGEGISGTRSRTKLEWRERWVTVKDGVLFLCKDREDLVPTRSLRLSSLAELRGAGHLARTIRPAQGRRKRAGADKGQNLSNTLSFSPPTSFFHGMERDNSENALAGDKNDPTYIPGSKEEADRAGLKIVCAKFQTNDRRAAKDVVTEDRAEKSKRPRYTSTGPSLSLLAGPTKTTGVDRHNKNQGSYLRKVESSALEKGKGKSGGSSGKLGMSGLFGGRKREKKKKRSEEPLTVSNRGTADDSTLKTEDDEDDSFSSGGHASEDEAAPAGSASDSSLTLSSPVFAHTDTDGNDDGFSSDEVRPSVTRFGGYRYGYVPSRKGDKYREREAPKKEGTATNGQKLQEREPTRHHVGDPREDNRSSEKKNQDEKGEWIVLDLRDDNAYTSLLRILHRHFSNPVESSFIQTLSAASSPPTPVSSETPFDDTKHKHNVLSSSSFLSAHTTPEDAVADNSDQDSNSSPQLERRKLERPSFLDSLARHPAKSSRFPSKTFGALPYPEWRIELVKRAQRAGLGDTGRALEALRYGISTLRPSSVFLDQMRTARPGGSFMTRDSDSISGASALTERPRRPSRSQKTKSASDDEHDNMSYVLELSDSEDENSEAEWHAWMADLHRQVEVRSNGQHVSPVGHSETSTLNEIDDSVDEKPPKTLEDDRLQEVNRRRKLEPSGTVTTSIPSTPNFSSEFSSLARTPPRQSTFTSQRHAINRTLRQSVSMQAEQLRSEASELRRPSMPILTSEQTFTFSQGTGSAVLIMEQSAVLTTGSSATAHQFPDPTEDMPDYLNTLPATSSPASQLPSAMPSLTSLRKSNSDMNAAGPSTGPRHSGSTTNAINATPIPDMKTNDGHPTAANTESTDFRRAQRPRLTVATPFNYEQSERDPNLSPGPELKHSKPSKRRFMRRVRSGSSLKSGPEEPGSPGVEPMGVVKKPKTSLAHNVERFMNRGVAALDSAMDFVDR